MKPVHTALTALLLATASPVVLSPVWGQSAPPEGEMEEGFSLMEEGAKLLLKGLMAEMEPALGEMEQALSGLEPALKELQPQMLALLALIDDLSNYDAPERLDNGDILIRRSPGAPPAPPLPGGDALPAPQTDL